MERERRERKDDGEMGKGDEKSRRLAACRCSASRFPHKALCALNRIWVSRLSISSNFFVKPSKPRVSVSIYISLSHWHSLHIEAFLILSSSFSYIIGLRTDWQAPSCHIDVMSTNFATSLTSTACVYRGRLSNASRPTLSFHSRMFFNYKSSRLSPKEGRLDPVNSSFCRHLDGAHPISSS